MSQMKDVMDTNEMYKKINNVPKTRDVYMSPIEDMKNDDFEYQQYSDHQFDEETEKMLRTLNIDNNHNYNNTLNKNIKNQIPSNDDNIDDINNNQNENENENGDENHNGQSKLKDKKIQLSPFAPEFNVMSSQQINPYGGPYGVQTRPVYVPPAQIPSRSQNLNNLTTKKIENAHMSRNGITNVNGNINLDVNVNASTVPPIVSSSKSPYHNPSESLQRPPNYFNLQQPQLSPNLFPQQDMLGGISPNQFNKLITEDDGINKNEDVNHLQPYVVPMGLGQNKLSPIQQSSNKKHYNKMDDIWKQQQQQQISYRGNPSKLRYPPHDPLTQSHLTVQNGVRMIPSPLTTATQNTGTAHFHSNVPSPIPIQMHPPQPQTATLQGPTPIGPTQPYKINPRNYGPPPSDAIDPKFTSPEDIRQFQKWELLESAKRWLPGEGTFITWKGYRYLIGAPIHMGMNGHIHYCYKYPIPIDENKDEKLETDVNGQLKLPPKVETVAAKIVPNTPAFAREICVLRALQDCENITELYEVLESERTLISILELAQADVFNFFVGRVAIRHGWNLDKPAIREHFARMVISNVVQGLDQMHQKNYLHCDLKSLNILLYIYSTGHSQRRGGVYIKAKLTDFGHSSFGETRIAEKLFSNGMARVGTAGHVAPELFIEGTSCGPKIDIWSLGIVMFSMLVPGRLLFGEYTNLETLKKAYDRLYKNPFSRDTPSWWSDFERLSPEARDLILWMTRYDEKERPTEAQILSHPWFEIANQKHKSGSYRPKLQWADMLSSSIAQE